MTNYDPAELLAICDSIVEDGELSRGEIRQLTQYLATHPHAKSHWPGKLFFDCLQDIWRDEKVTVREARTIGSLILQVRKEAAQRQGTATPASTGDVVTESLKVFDPRAPFLPPIPLETRIACESDPKANYEVNLRGPTCTCPDFQKHRSGFREGHLTRCCKHVFTAYAGLEPATGWPTWMGAYLNHAFKAHPTQEWEILLSSSSAAPILISSAPVEWANVFAAVNGKYDRFGYSVYDNRWAYGTEPPESRRIATAIHRLTQESHGR